MLWQVLCSPSAYATAPSQPRYCSGLTCMVAPQGQHVTCGTHSIDVAPRVIAALWQPLHPGRDQLFVRKQVRIHLPAAEGSQKRRAVHECAAAISSAARCAPQPPPTAAAASKARAALLITVTIAAALLLLILAVATEAAATQLPRASPAAAARCAARAHATLRAAPFFGSSILPGRAGAAGNAAQAPACSGVRLWRQRAPHAARTAACCSAAAAAAMGCCMLAMAAEGDGQRGVGAVAHAQAFSGRVERAQQCGCVQLEHVRPHHERLARWQRTPSWQHRLRERGLCGGAGRRERGGGAVWDGARRHIEM